jgi:hypothetical protein
MDSAPEIEFLLAMKLFHSKIVFALLLLAGSAMAQDRPGKVEFSDTNVISGVISLSPGSQLKIQAGKQIRALSLDRVAELRIAPERQELERAWRFKEAGQTAKDYYGEPYPVLYLVATAKLANGETVTGHLYTTVLYVTDGDNVQKVILLAKMRGKEGMQFESVVYPKVISFSDSTASVDSTIRLRLSGLPPKTEVVGIARGALTRLEAKREANGEFKLLSPLGEQFFLATRTGTKLTAGWPAATEEKLITQVRTALTNAPDFFDDRRVLGAFADTTNSTVYSLILAARKAKTVSSETHGQPWRLEIYRWKQDDEGRLMLAGHDHFFRGITAKGEELPTVDLSEKLWNIHPREGVWTDADK